ncbi:MAG TPA: VTT domain-containing protein, partial [Gammaproteobacteria bacterium]|nr:VTT domain-containing protein [Gammaproteobacteria bacterium]
MMEYLGGLLDWIGAHAVWAGPVVFLVAMTESLALVGLIVPGAVLMFGFGALIGSGRLEFWPIMLWAVAGAIVGDGCSYLLGRWLGPRLGQIPPFRQRPQLLAAGIGFFQRHGAKSIVLGRFVGPLRPVIPAVAGMLRMPASQFLITNVLSAIFWAPAYLLPGVVLVASLSLAAAVAGRLLTLGLLALLLGWLLVVMLRRLYRRANGYGRRALWLSLALATVLGGLTLGRLVGPWSTSEPVQLMSWRDWQAHAWQLTPTRRQGLFGEGEPFAFQFAARSVDIARALVQTGWQLPQAFDIRSALLWLSPEVDLVRTPPLPQYHAGRPPELVFVRYFDGSRLILRAWRSDRAVKAGVWPVWLVTVERESLTPGWPWLRRQRLAVPEQVLTELRTALTAQVRAD